jgi:hypothetical protein
MLIGYKNTSQVSTSFATFDEQYQLVSTEIIIQDVSAKTFKPNNSVIFQRIFVKFKMQIF